VFAGILFIATDTHVIFLSTAHFEIQTLPGKQYLIACNHGHLINRTLFRKAADGFPDHTYIIPGFPIIFDSAEIGTFPDTRALQDD